MVGDRISSRAAMKILGHKTHYVFDRHNIIIVSQEDLKVAAERQAGVLRTQEESRAFSVGCLRFSYNFPKKNPQRMGVSRATA